MPWAPAFEIDFQKSYFPALIRIHTTAWSLTSWMPFIWILRGNMSKLCCPDSSWNCTKTRQTTPCLSFFSCSYYAHQAHSFRLQSLYVSMKILVLELVRFDAMTHRKMVCVWMFQCLVCSVVNLSSWEPETACDLLPKTKQLRCCHRSPDSPPLIQTWLSDRL